MRVLLELDYKDYNENGNIGKRPSARGIIINGNKIAMVYSYKYDYYKFPGGGIEKDESNIDALIREVKEETGLEVIKDSIKEYGLIVKKDKGKYEDIFIQENYYYLCNCKNILHEKKLDSYEEDEQFSLKWASAREIIDTNMTHDHFDKNFKDKYMHMLEREITVINKLVEEGYIKLN